MAVAVAAEPSQSSAPDTMKVSQIGWSPTRDLDAIEWACTGRRLGTVGRCIQWLIGDWIAWGNERFGERYARASKITGYDTQTLMNMVYVASRFSFSRRRENLSWSHHEALASVGVEEQEEWLDRAAEHRWSVADLRMMLRMSRKKVDASLDDAGSAPSNVVKCPRCGEEVPLTSR
jgi:hypothetical protein